MTTHAFHPGADVPEYCQCGWHRESTVHGDPPRSIADIDKRADKIYVDLLRDGISVDAACFIAAMFSRLEVLERHIEELQSHD